MENDRKMIRYSQARWPGARKKKGMSATRNARAISQMYMVLRRFHRST